MSSTPPHNPLRRMGFIHRDYWRVVDGPLRDFGFAMGQLPVLMALKNGESLAQAELARLARVEQPSMAQLLNRMERDGLIVRVDDPRDRRSRLVSLAVGVIERMQAARTMMDAVGQEALDGFSDEEIERLDDMLKRVAANLERMARGADEAA